MDPTSEQKPFYTPEGQVADKKVAEELAYLEKPARDREAELKRQYETGLTEQQRANIEIMNGIEEKYPLAFQKYVDLKGRKILTLGTAGNQEEMWGLGPHLFITQEGIITYQHGQSFSPDEVDFTRFLDNVMSGEFIEDRGYMKFRKDDVLLPKFINRGEAGDEVFFFKVDLGEERMLKSMRTQFEKSQTWQESYRREQAEKQVKLDPRAVLGQL